MKKPLWTGREIKAIRQKEGWSQSKLAKSLGYSTSYLRKIENEKFPMTKEFDLEFDKWIIRFSTYYYLPDVFTDNDIKDIYRKKNWPLRTAIFILFVVIISLILKGI